MSNKLNSLTAITPLDGRYAGKTQPLQEIVSEYGLIKIRIEIEVKYLIALSESKIIRKLTQKEKNLLYSVYENFDTDEAIKVKELEQITRHDVKAMERYLRLRLDKTSLSDIVEMIHFGLTSWDINNIAYNLQLQRPTREIIVPILEEIIKKLTQMASENKNVVMLARTHGQPAVPTTLGKELAIFAIRLKREVDKLNKYTLTGKLNGAVGNYNALVASYPKVNWISFSKNFVASTGLTPSTYTTQINPYDDVAEYVQIYERINNILIGFSQDMWRYISDNWFAQENKKGEVGSSTMPQKVNPIDFENAEGNLGLANSIFEYLVRKLPISRLQRDLSDSTVLRNIGTALGYSLISYESLLIGLSRVKPNKAEIEKRLNEDWTILTEGVQTILRKAGVDDPYSLVATLSRGKHIGKDEWKEWIEKLPVDEKYKKELEKLTPQTYTGLARELTEKAIKELKK